MSKRNVLGFAGFGLMAGVLGYVAHAARAGGIPTPNTMAYTGVLTNASGAPVANQGVTLSIWNVASGGTSPVCGPYAAVTTGTDGSFKVALDAACVTVVHATPNLWTQILVIGQASPMPRTQIGAVPYAVEAARTVVDVNSKLYSVGATYCGSAPVTINTTSLVSLVPGAANGYAAGKSLCETACSSPSAHMCSADDLIRSLALGVAVPSGGLGSYIATGTYAPVSPGSVNDCGGWMVGYQGTVWGGNSGGLSSAYCFTGQPLLCCD
jgi:hypothetical protein